MILTKNNLKLCSPIVHTDVNHGFFERNRAIHYSATIVPTDVLEYPGRG